jgi:hypothetical protein
MYLDLGRTISKPPLNEFLFLQLPQLFSALTVALRLRTTWRLLVFLLTSYVYLNGIRFTTGNIDRDYILGIAFAWLIANALHVLLLSEPLDDFRHEKDTVSPREMSFFRRVYWALCLQNAFRGIGWNYKVCDL